MKAPLPANEEERLKVLHRYQILDTPPEQEFDDLSLLASQICQTPFAQISLVDAERQWFKSRIGSEATETPRDIAFCAHTILHVDQVMEVRDAKADPRFCENPLVTSGSQIRFYAGAPLVAPDGHALGALCVMDRNPRKLNPEQVATLQALSRHVVAQLELKRQTRGLIEEVVAREKVEAELREKYEQLSASQRETNRLLELAHKSRRALLSVLEDEKRSGQHLRESEERFRQVVENIREVFWLIDLAEGRIIYISPGYEQISGRSREELYNSPDSWLQYIQVEDRRRVQEAVARRAVTGTFDETFRLARPDGDVRWLRGRAFPVTEPDGSVRRIVGIADDITDQKKLEQQFLHAQRMEAIGALASGVAHDLNNILAPILMVSGLLKRTAATAKEREMLGLMERSGTRGADIIRQLLTFSRGAPGERITLQPKHLVRDMMQIMRQTFPRNITVEEIIGNDLWTIEADATQIHQIIMNLCVNARDAMPDGGTLTVAANNFDLLSGEPPVNDLKPGKYVLLKVKDTGHGIPPDVIDRIFEPFFTTKEIGKGTGLGLSTVLGIVRNYEGALRVLSQPCQGSTFEIYIPASPRQSGTGPGQSEEEPPMGHGELILIVDDETMILEPTRDFLKLRGYKVVTASSGEEGIKLFVANQGELRLIIADVMMRGMGGLAMIHAVRALSSSVPILVLSGLGLGQNAAELARIGVTRLLAKPIAPNELVEEVSRALVV